MFNCTKCGLCCSNIGKAIENAKGRDGELMKELAAFPYKYDESGRCENLGEDKMCKIYETRPDICSVNKIYEKYMREEMSTDEWYAVNEAACRQALIDTPVAVIP